MICAAFRASRRCRRRRASAGHLGHYQQEGLGWLQFLRRFRLGESWLTTWVGKTVQTIGTLGMGDEKGRGRLSKPVLIVAPVSDWYWKQERPFAPELSCTHAGASAKIPVEAQGHTDHHHRLPIVADRQRDPVGPDFGLVILDEAQMIKNPTRKSRRWPARYAPTVVCA